MVYRDQRVRCAACGADFVDTVREQRARAAEGLGSDAPLYCRDCRGADVRLAGAGAVSEGEPPSRSPRPSTGRRAGRPGGQTGRALGRSGPGRGREPGRGSATRRNRQTELRFRYMGVVKWFDDDKAYGFIAGHESDDELFVHISAIIVPGARTLHEGQAVEYEVERTARGLQAVDVIPLDA